MDLRVLYLDIDDEITTAAARVRGSEGTRVAVVLPHGSRVATSRINFRLLSRDATLNGKRLSIVAGDAATRALAASAGLPIFASVAEYEASIERGEDDEGATAEPAPTPASSDVAVDQPAEPAAEPAAPPAAATSVRSSTSPRGSGRRRSRGAAPSDDTIAASLWTSAAGAEAIAGAAAGAGVGSVVEAATSPVAPIDVPLSPDSSAAAVADATSASVPAAHPAGRNPAAVSAARVMADSPTQAPSGAPVFGAGSRVVTAPVGRRFGPRGVRAPAIVGVAVLALAVLVGGVGAYVFLPTATAVIVPREIAIGPVQLRIVADPAAEAPDAAAKTVPAETRTIDVEATQAFPVTGKRVEEVKATGTVRFRNFDADSANTIPRGSIVATRSGVRFRTDKAVTVPRAEQVLFQVFPSSATVEVTAVEGGPEGNVDENTIRVIPRGENPQTVDVTNQETTKGGKRDEFPRVVQADIDAATAAIGQALATDFTAKLADPGLESDGITVFEETGELGPPVYPVDPATLLDDEVETFELGATAQGTVLAVDGSAVQAVAEANIETQVQAGYALVDGSSSVAASPGQVIDGVITFPAEITARQMLIIDPAAIEAEIRGRTLADAETILDGYGQAELSVWPDWVTSVPTLDARVDVRSEPAEAS